MRAVRRGPLPHSESTVRRLSWAVFAAAACLFAVIAYDVTHAGPLAHLDVRVAAWLHDHGSRTLTRLMLFITHAHAPIAIDAYSALVALLLARRREWHWLAALAAAAPGGLILNGLLKQVFQRGRPAFDDPLLTLSTYSFPSGHTAGALLFYGMVAAYLLARTDSPRVACVVIWLFMVGLVGFSRMYLGVHFLSDVLGAAAWSLAWLVLCLMGIPLLRKRAARIAH